MNGGFILRNKKGSVTAAVLLFILAGGFSIRNHRLLRSHIYLDKGIYSVDVRIQEFLVDLNEIEMILNEKYDGIDFLNHMKKGRKERIGNYSIYYETSYNEDSIHILIVEDTTLKYLRRVEIVLEAEEILLINKGV